LMDNIFFLKKFQMDYNFYLDFGSQLVKTL
jgi:hypothetical protein